MTVSRTGIGIVFAAACALPLTVEVRAEDAAPSAPAPASPPAAPVQTPAAAPTPASPPVAAPAPTPPPAAAAPKGGDPSAEAPAKAEGSPSGPAPSTAPAAGLDQTIKGLYYPHYRGNEKVAIVQGDYAVLSSKNDSFDIVRPVITLFHAVEGSSERGKVVIQGDTGLYHRGTNQARIEGRVVVRQEDGSELRTDRLEVDIPQKRCTTDRRVDLSKPGLALSGTGMEASDLLSVMTLQSQVTAAIRGSLGSLLQPAGAAEPKPDGGAETFLACDGPATLARLASPRADSGATLELRLARNVVMTRHDPEGMTRTSADAATIDLFHGPDPAPPAGATAAVITEARHAVLTGSVKVFQEQGLSGTAQRLEWAKADERLALQSDADGGVRLSRATHTIAARSVVMLRRENRMECRQGAQVTFVPAGSPDGAAAGGAAPSPWTVRGDAVLLRLRPDAKDLDGLDATGHVEIASEVPAGAAGAQVASGDTFRWDGAARRGMLTGAPALIRQGGDRMEAARVALLPADQRVVLQGPKRIELAGGISATARGDIAIASGEGLIEVGDEARVSTPAVRIEADRLRLALAQGGFQRAVGWGHVRVSDRVNGSDAIGDHLQWEVKTEEFVVEGTPRARLIVPGSGDIQGEEIRMSRQSDGLRCVNNNGKKGRLHISGEESRRVQ